MARQPLASLSRPQYPSPSREFRAFGVVRNAVENANSVATMLRTTETMVADVPEKNAAAAMGGMM